MLTCSSPKAELLQIWKIAWKNKEAKNTPKTTTKPLLPHPTPPPARQQQQKHPQNNLFQFLKMFCWSSNNICPDITIKVGWVSSPTVVVYLSTSNKIIWWSPSIDFAPFVPGVLLLWPHACGFEPIDVDDTGDRSSPLDRILQPWPPHSTQNLKVTTNTLKTTLYPKTTTQNHCGKSTEQNHHGKTTKTLSTHRVK